MTQSVYRIKTLGALIVYRDGDIVEDFLTLKTALLFIYLAMNPGEHTRNTLAALLWSETSDEQALKNLRTVLSNLRKNIPEAVVISRKTVQINAEVQVDARAFETDCDAIFAGATPSSDDLLALATLYEDEFLSGVYVRQAHSLEQWIVFQRDALHQKYLQLLFHITSHCIETCAFYQGIEVARQLVNLNPLWEAARRHLMQLLVYLEQPGEAQLEYERLVALLASELGVTPDPETVALYEAIKSGTIAQPCQHNPARIVLPDLPCVIPATDMTYLREMLLSPDCRLITLTGIGGAGKSTLATLIAHERQTEYRDGVMMVSLVSMDNEQAMARAILGSLGMNVNEATALDQVITAIKSRDMLLVLDNYESMLPHTRLVERILEDAPDVQLLITSQAALNLRHEWLLPLQGLQIVKADSDDEEAADSEAVQLFIQTARRMSPRFDPAPFMDDIVEICRFLEGLPLGIVIAAGQVKYLTPHNILTSLQDDMLAMTGVYRDMPDRHQGFARLIYDTVERLSPEEEYILMALSIFRGSFSAEAALMVAGVNMVTFMHLVDKSLIQRVENFRYKIHSVLRTIFVEELNHSDDKDPIRHRLTAYYQNWCQALFRNHPHSPDNLVLIEQEHMNIWHLDLMTDEEQQRYVLEILATMHHYWRNRGYSDRIVPILRAAIENEVHPIELRVHGKVELSTILITIGQQDIAQGLCEEVMALAPDYLYERVRALQHLTRITMRRGDYDTAWGYLEQVVELELQHPEASEAAIKYLFMSNHVGMGWVAIERNDLEIARLHLNLAMQGWIEMDEPLQIAQVRINLGLLDSREGFHKAAQEHFREVIPIAEAARNHIISLTAMGNLGKSLMMMGNYTEACDYLIKSTRLAQDLKAKTSVLYQLETFAHMAILMETYTIAAQLYGYLLEGSERENVAFSPPTVVRMDEYAETMRDELGARFESLVAAGRKMPESLALTLAESLTSYAARIEQIPD